MGRARFMSEWSEKRKCIRATNKRETIGNVANQVNRQLGSGCGNCCKRGIHTLNKNETKTTHSSYKISKHPTKCQISNFDPCRCNTMTSKQSLQGHGEITLAKCTIRRLRRESQQNDEQNSGAMAQEDNVRSGGRYQAGACMFQSAVPDGQMGVLLGF